MTWFEVTRWHEFHYALVFVAPFGVALGVTMLVIGNREPPLPRWVGQVSTAAILLGLAIGIGVAMYLRLAL